MRFKKIIDLVSQHIEWRVEKLQPSVRRRGDADHRVFNKTERRNRAHAGTAQQAGGATQKGGRRGARGTANPQERHQQAAGQTKTPSDKDEGPRKSAPNSQGSV